MPYLASWGHQACQRGTHRMSDGRWSSLPQSPLSQLWEKCDRNAFEIKIELNHSSNCFPFIIIQSWVRSSRWITLFYMWESADDVKSNSAECRSQTTIRLIHMLIGTYGSERQELEQKYVDFGIRYTWVSVLTLPFTSQVTLATLSLLSLRFLSCKMEVLKFSLDGCWRVKWGNACYVPIGYLIDGSCIRMLLV